MVNEFIQTTVVYASETQQHMVPVKVQKGATLLEVILRSGLLELFPEIDLTQQKVGVFGKIKPLETVLEPGDRVEIYRPLKIDPKEVRRLKAKKIS